MQLPPTKTNNNGTRACSTCRLFGCSVGCDETLALDSATEATPPSPRVHSLRLCWGGNETPCGADEEKEVAFASSAPRPLALGEEAEKGGLSSEGGDRECVLQVLGIRSLSCAVCEGGLVEGAREQEQKVFSPKALPPLQHAGSAASSVGKDSAFALGSFTSGEDLDEANSNRTTKSSGWRRLPVLEQIPHFHLRPVSKTLGDDGAGREEEGRRRCCLVVLNSTRAEIAEFRASLLVLGCAWLEFASLSPLQRALRTIAVRVMEEDSALRGLRALFRVVGGVRPGAVSRKSLSLFLSRPLRMRERKCGRERDEEFGGWAVRAGRRLLQSLALVRDLLAVEFGLSAADLVFSESLPLFKAAPLGGPETSTLEMALAFAAVHSSPPLQSLLPFWKTLHAALQAIPREEAEESRCAEESQPQPASMTATVSEDTNSAFSTNSPVSPVVQWSSSTDPQRDCQSGAASSEAFEEKIGGLETSLMSRALVCIDTDGSESVDAEEMLAASMSQKDFLDRMPSCR